MSQVLVIDDSIEVLKVSTAMLRHLGQEPICAGDGEEGLAVLKAARPDLVISDVVMPKLDGISLFRRVQEDAALAGVPWVMMSSPNRKQEALGAGCPYFLSKPFTLDDLKALVKGLLGHRV